MKRGELERILRQNGCYPLGTGKKHDQWFSPKSGLKILLPRHTAREIPVGTLRIILKKAGLLI
ncbi:MAG: type II toxin-antitoxin system HicA family toxin [Bacteroidales bacterium]|nr:type II toxin-antitoxin system HicA family toxin [Bacteroidales bacterium]